MACIVRLALGSEQLHGSPFPEKTLAVRSQRLVLSYFSTFQGIPGPHED